MSDWFYYYHVSAASDLGLHCLRMSLLWDTRHKWFKVLIINTADIFFFFFFFFVFLGKKKAYISEGRPVEMLIMNEHPIYSKYLDRLVQTVSTSIKLLLKQQFDQGLHYLPFYHKFQSEITWAQLFKTNDAVSQQKYLN